MKIEFDPPHFFDESLEFAESRSESIEGFLDKFTQDPRYTSWSKNQSGKNDRGTDYWLHRLNGPDQSIDIKTRRKYYSDLCIETTSVYKGETWIGAKRNLPFDDKFRVKIGWTIDPTKRTDFILWQWPHPDGEGFLFRLDSYPQLRHAVISNLEAWRNEYGELGVPNRTYETLCMFVPLDVVDTAMRYMQ